MASVGITPKNPHAVDTLCSAMSSLTITSSASPVQASSSASPMGLTPEKVAVKTAIVCVKDLEAIFNRNLEASSKQQSKQGLITIPVKVTVNKVEYSSVFMLNPSDLLKTCGQLLDSYKDKTKNNPILENCINKIMKETAIQINKHHPDIGLYMASCEPKLSQGYEHSLALRAVVTNIVVGKFTPEIIALFKK